MTNEDVTIALGFDAIALRKRVLTRKPPRPYSRLTELIAIVDAGWKAQKTRKGVCLKELPGWKGNQEWTVSGSWGLLDGVL